MTETAYIDSKPFYLFLLLSALIHAAALSMLKSSPTSPVERSISVSLVESAPKQIVSPPDFSQDLTPPKKTNFVSDANYRAKREQIRRGSGKPTSGSKAAISTKSRPIASQRKPEGSKSQKRIEVFKLSQSALMEKFGKVDKQKGEPRHKYQEFSRPPGSGATLSLPGGIRDYLPDLPDGDITLLNAKASKFAVFVRRVAIRVFGGMRSSGWEELTSGDIMRISRFAVVNASMDLEGALTGATVVESSGSPRFDRMVLESVKNYISDKNPPPEAALSDGKIHFIFQARSWVRGAPNSQGGISERRWLLLGTGLK